MSAAKHTPGQQCDECEGFCLVPVTALRTPVQAVHWVCHASTTIKDADGKVLAECSGHGHYSEHDEAVAAEIVQRVNVHDELVALLREVLDANGSTLLDTNIKPRINAAIAKATESAA